MDDVVVFRHAWDLVLWRGAWASPSGLVVRNLFRRYEVAWSEILAITPPPPHSTNRHRGIRLLLRDGSVVSIGAFKEGWAGNTRRTLAVVDELKSLRDGYLRASVPR